MSKFAKKEATAEAPKGKEKTWTNDPSMQEDGKTTEKGKAARKAKGMSETETEKVPGFAKGAKAAKGKAPAKGKTPPKKEAANIADAKIKVLKKDHGAREGSKRAAWFDALVSSKTISQAQSKVEGLNSSVIRVAEEQGIIELS